MDEKPERRWVTTEIKGMELDLHGLVGNLDEVIARLQVIRAKVKKKVKFRNPEIGYKFDDWGALQRVRVCAEQLETDKEHEHRVRNWEKRQATEKKKQEEKDAKEVKLMHKLMSKHPDKVKVK